MVMGWNFITFHKWMLLCGGLLYVTGVVLLYHHLPRPEQHFDIDSGAYHAAALQKNVSGKFDLNGKPFLHPLGYPAFLSVLYKFFGQHVAWVVFFQAVFVFLSMIAITLTALYWYGQKTAFYAFFLALTNVGFYIFPQVLLVESLQLFCIAWVWERFSLFLQTKNKSHIAASGLFAGLSLLFKPSAFYLPWIILVFFFVTSSSKKDFIRTYGKEIILFMGVFYSPILVIMLRNWFVWGYGKFSFLFEENLYFYFYQQLLTRAYGYTEQQAWALFAQLIDTTYLAFDERHWLSIKMNFLQDLKTYSVQACIIWIQNGIKNCFGLYTRTLVILEKPALQQNLPSFFSSYKGYLTGTTFFTMCLGSCEALYSGMRWMLLVIGLGQQKKDTVFWLTLLSGFYFLGLLCMAGNGRYRFVFEPLGIVFTAHVLHTCILSVPSLKTFLFRRVA